MYSTTLIAVRSILKADPSVNTTERNYLISLLRQGPPVEKKIVIPTVPVTACLIRRGEVARRLSVSLRTVDSLAQAGTLRKRIFPGRKRASGFLEADLVALLNG